MLTIAGLLQQVSDKVGKPVHRLTIYDHDLKMHRPLTDMGQIPPSGKMILKIAEVTLTVP